MAHHIHIHIGTRDAGFDESKHPRDHGKFTSAGGGSSSTATAKAGSGAVKPASEWKVSYYHKRVLEAVHKHGSLEGASRSLALPMTGVRAVMKRIRDDNGLTGMSNEAVAKAWGSRGK